MKFFEGWIKNTVDNTLQRIADEALRVLLYNSQPSDYDISVVLQLTSCSNSIQGSSKFHEGNLRI